MPFWQKGLIGGKNLDHAPEEVGTIRQCSAYGKRDDSSAENRCPTSGKQ
jgi:hypothetical protein